MTDYTPPAVWQWTKPSGGKFASINRPIAGATHDAALPAGHHPLQLYSLGTPNGVKVTILLYLAEKFAAFLPTDPAARTAALSWVMWQMGSAPFLGGGFGHFYAYAPTKIEYAIDRYAMEVKRQYDVLDRHLANSEYMAGAEFSIADIAIWPWYGAVALGQAYPGAATFLALDEYRHVRRWIDQLALRPAVQRGRRINRKPTEANPEFLPERHAARDLDR